MTTHDTPNWFLTARRRVCGTNAGGAVRRVKIGLGHGSSRWRARRWSCTASDVDPGAMHGGLQAGSA
jgi:hypothetical protein